MISKHGKRIKSHRLFLCQSSEKEFHYFFITVHTDKRKNIFFLPVP